jgi:hypothetical protein
MALAIKSLFKAQLGTTEADLYGPASGKAAIIKSIRLVNTGGSAVTVNLSVRRGATGSSFRILPKDLSLPSGGALIDDSEVTLEVVGTDRDFIRGFASAASTMDCVLSGVERDQ